jgi:hypothetical protein
VLVSKLLLQFLKLLLFAFADGEILISFLALLEGVSTYTALRQLSKAANKIVVLVQVLGEKETNP